MFNFAFFLVRFYFVYTAYPTKIQSLQMFLLILNLIILINYLFPFMDI